MKLRSTVFILGLMIVASLSSYTINIAAVSIVENAELLGSKEYQIRRTTLRETLEPIDAVVVMKSYIETANGMRRINKVFDYLTGANAVENKDMLAGSMLVMSYRASFIVLNVDNPAQYNALKRWLVNNSGFASNQVLQLNEKTSSVLKRYFSQNSLVLLQQIYNKEQVEFRDKELADWAQEFVNRPIFPDAQEFSPDYLVMKIARYKSEDEKKKLAKASETLDKSMKFTAQFLPKSLPVPEGAIFIDNELLNEIKRKASSWMFRVSAKPAFNKKNKKLEGYKILRLPKDKVFDTLKLYVGDVILKVNGKMQAFTALLQQFLQNLATRGGTLSIEIKRKNKIVKQIYYVIPTNNVGNVEVDVFRHLYAKTMLENGASEFTSLQLYRLKNGKYEEIKDIVKPSDAVLMKGSMSVDDYTVFSNHTVNLSDAKYKISEIEDKIAKSATKLKEMLAQKSTFTNIKSTLKKEFNVNVDFTHTGFFTNKTFPEEIYPLENSVYQILFKLGNYSFLTDSCALAKADKDAKKYKVKSVSVLRNLNESAYEKFRKMGLEVLPTMYSPKNSNLKYFALKIKDTSVGPFMTMPFQKKDVVLEINSTRIADCFSTGLIDKFANLSVKPFISTVSSKDGINVLLTTSNFYNDFRLDPLLNLTDECFYHIKSMINNEKYQNRLPMSNQAGLTAGMACDLLKNLGYKTLPGMISDIDGFYLRSRLSFGRTDIAGILTSEGSKKNVLLKVSIPYDFSNEKNAVSHNAVNSLLALGFGLSNILCSNDDVDVLIHFYSQTDAPLKLPEQTTKFLDMYENVVNIEFRMDDKVNDVRLEFADAEAKKSVFDYYKNPLELTGFNLLKTSQTKDFAKDSMLDIDPKKDLSVRFVIPATKDDNLSMLKTARLIALIPSIITSKMLESQK